MAKKTIWSVRSAVTGGSWNLDALGGLLNGIIYVPRSVVNKVNGKFYAVATDEGVTDGTNLVGLTPGDVTITLDSDIPNNDYIAYRVVKGEAGAVGLEQIDADFSDAGSSGDFVTQPEFDSAVGGIRTDLNLKVTQGDVAKVSKGTVASSQVVSPLATGATLEQTVAKVNEAITTLNTVRSTAGAGITAANQTIDALTNGKVMKS